MALFEITSTCKGGGYMYCRTKPAHPKANAKGLYPLHRVVLENKLGRLLEANEDAHHINGDKNDNSPENLEPLLHTEHAKYHHPKVESLVTATCPVCEKEFETAQHDYRHRVRRNKSRQVFCSLRCSGKGTASPRAAL